MNGHVFGILAASPFVATSGDWTAFLHLSVDYSRNLLMKRLVRVQAEVGLDIRHKRRLVALAAIAAAGLAGVFAALAGGRPERTGGSARSLGLTAGADVAAPLAQPSAQLRPEEVVRRQLDALRENGHGEEGIRRCYQFASPFNRAATGPFSRFAEMVRSPPYDVMLRATDTLVGAAVEREGRAAVLVTIVDPTRSVHVFRFILSKQRHAPYEDCWMTDAVSGVPSNTRLR
jgi:hypothetical protein